MLTSKAALRDVERATKARLRVDADSTAAKERQAAATRVALDVGASVADLSHITGLTPQRIYQIRDGRR